MWRMRPQRADPAPGRVGAGHGQHHDRGERDASRTPAAPRELVRLAARQQRAASTITSPPTQTAIASRCSVSATIDSQVGFVVVACPVAENV